MSMKRVTLQPAYVLHRRPYRETSFLVDLFSQEHGRVTVVASGARKTKSATQGLLQPFIPLVVSFSGKGELMALSHVEANGNVARLQGECLFAGFYLNELLTVLLQKWDAHSELYRLYEEALQGLHTSELQQAVLRTFELRLLEELGYGVLPKDSGELAAMFAAEKYYRFIPEQGFILSELDKHAPASSNVFLGKSLLAMAQENWQDESCLKDAKRLIRFVLTPLLGARQIYSRQLFIHREVTNEA